MAKAIEPSLTRQLFNMAKKYNDVIDLTLGDPDIPPLNSIKKAACNAIMSGKTRYSENAGLLELRECICKCFYKEYSLNVNPKSEIIVTVGGMEALFLTFAAILDVGDEVILQAPYYVNYIQMIKMCGGVPVLINTTEESGFQLDENQIREKISDRTVAIILNSPGNPSGTILSSNLLDTIAQIAEENDLLVISDEVYSKILFDNKKYDSIITRPNMKKRTVLIDSISKRFSMTGYRIGYAIAPAELISNMTKMQENICACAPLPSQYAAIQAYTSCIEDKSICNTFEKRRDFLVEAINNTKGLKCQKPGGAFYLFVNIGETGMNCLDFAYELLEREHVAIVPAIAYGESYANYIRIAFTLEIEELQKAMRRIADFTNYIK